MNLRCSVLLIGLFLAAVLVLPAHGEVTPLWTQHGTSGGDLSCVIISPDDKTILIGGDQLMSLSRDGKNRWTGSSGEHLAISTQGDYILSSAGPTIRLLASDGRLVWDQNLESAVTDVSMAPDASLIAAAGGGKLRTITFSGDAIAQNATVTINHVSVLPSARQLIVTTNKDVQILDLSLRINWSDSNATQDLLAVAPDGSSFVTATNNRVRMYRGNGNLTWDRKIEGESVEALAYSRDLSTIVLGTDHNTIIALNRNGTQVFSANATAPVTSIAVSGDGNTIVAGSLDKKAYVFNHAGANLGTFGTKTAIRSNSVAVTSDGQLIVVVDASAAYGILRSSFTGDAVARDETPAVTTSATWIPDTAVSVPATRRVTTRAPTVPTPYPSEYVTEESPLPPVISFLAVVFVILFGRAVQRRP